MSYRAQQLFPPREERGLQKYHHSLLLQASLMAADMPIVIPDFQARSVPRETCDRVTTLLDTESTVRSTCTSASNVHQRPIVIVVAAV